MYRLVVRLVARRTFRHLSAGRVDRFMRVFGPDSVFCLAGDHAVGGEQHGADEIRRLIDRMRRLFPDLQVTPVRMLVSGWPWRTFVATRLVMTASLPDRSTYRNHGLQHIELRWGKVVEDRIYADTDVLRAALRVLADHGFEEATAA